MKLFHWSNQMVGDQDPEFENNDAINASVELIMYAMQMAADRAANPGPDIVTKLIEADVDGHKLSDDEFGFFVILLAVAGNETTRNAISHGIHALIEHPEQWQALREDPSLVDGAVEEILRWATPVMYFRRTATADVELGGEVIPAGDLVSFWHMSANRDEDVFTDPYTFDIRRTDSQNTLHVAFGGGGPHFCLGANLARAEIKVMLTELLRRMETIELAGPVRRLRSNFINGIKEMPVTFTPAS
jgi:cholest-4-en-3-one 26-monooxygenase